MKKTLIIVCDKKREKFGKYLTQLISMDDDTEAKTIGTKDGVVEAQLWIDEDFYKANKQTTSSDQYFLFIGNSKELKNTREFMNVDFEKYGIKYGSLGKQAFITVEHVVNHKDYNDFYEYAKNYAKNIDKIINSKFKAGTKTAVGMGVGAAFAKTAATFSAVIGGNIALTLLGPLISIPIGIRLHQDKKIKEQMYNCAVMKFYLDYLSDFLN